ncbi:malto-oligosyltrehalose trehalohydrolase [Sulfolobus acidocaldarius SUSAZ]|nr:malto-oligosyltrehalose trehalohydrolase [Sulfolobus acidocaldarius SUSAZ]
MFSFGGNLEKNKGIFKLWAPYVNNVKLKLSKKLIPMEKNDEGFFEVEIDDVEENLTYSFVIEDKREIPDPASRYQPLGVHDKSQLIKTDYQILDLGKLKIEDLIIYELHVGTFSPEGNFKGVIEKLDYLKDLGITGIELMPVAQFPGNRDWGYDGVFLYAVQNTYGGPWELAKLVNEAHKRGISVILDVVYNHIGPEGNYLLGLGPYFSDRYKTPWGLTFNFDDRGCDQVRKFILENVEYWFKTYKIDGLRLDAVHAIFDNSPKHILQEIAEKAHQLGKFVIAESDLNDPKIVKDDCGYKIDAQWVDDFHHAVHAFITKEKDYYYQDFGRIEDIEKTFKDVFVYDGKYSRYRGRTHGAPVGDLPPCKFVVFIQNHDQVGNRGNGERLSMLTDKKTYLMAATLYILSPYIPLIFMGEEYYETNPFLFFSDFSDPVLIKGVREGRLKENNQTIDPQSEEAFLKSKLSWKIDEEVLDYYKQLINIRKRYNNCKRIKEVRREGNSITLIMEKIGIIASFDDTVISSKITGSLLIGRGFPKTLKKDELIKVSRGVGVYQLE